MRSIAIRLKPSPPPETHRRSWPGTLASHLFFLVLGVVIALACIRADQGEGVALVVGLGGWLGSVFWTLRRERRKVAERTAWLLNALARKVRLSEAELARRLGIDAGELRRWAIHGISRQRMRQLAALARRGLAARTRQY